MAVKERAPAAAGKRSQPKRPPPQGRWTYDDYAQLPDNGLRYEVIKGELYMSPAPSPDHQRASFDIAFAINQFVKQHNLGQIFHAPLDVILPGRATPVQPDILFISHQRREIIKEKFIEGAPDLIVEVISPGNPAHDRRVKFHLYAEAGVPEYWLVDPIACTIEIYVLRGQAYAPLGPFNAGDIAYSEQLPEFTLPVKEICP
jgi:Uma2 family endonuclease